MDEVLIDFNIKLSIDGRHWIKKSIFLTILKHFNNVLLDFIVKLIA